ncbi:P-loop containing nucleoside triphosphate hydrolase protein [Trichophaea hybrida]|nr:P-loop containing nucleoside triphosphate hydrolase protein [Trichophaea hybrida]
MPHAASASRPPSIPATVFLTPLKNCLLNLPASLVSVLVSQNTPAQNVVVEISFRGSTIGSASSVQRTAFAGWTGMQSKRKPTAGTPLRSGDDAVIEMDPALARNIGVTEGTKVSVQLHIDPPAAHTVHIEPLTASDWEIIELHASFLELNLLSQIRCVSTAHPLSVYLSPTSTASIRLTKVEPESSLSSANGKPSFLGKDRAILEGVVLPYARHLPITDGENQEDENNDEMNGGGRGFTVYLDPSALSSKQLRGTSKVVVSIVRPTSLLPPKDPSQQEQQLGEKDKKEKEHDPTSATRIVANTKEWDSAPDAKHVALSRHLSAALQLFEGEVGPMIRLEAALQPVPHKILAKVKIYPFQKGEKEDGVRWAGGTKRLEDMAIARIWDVLGPKRQRNGTKAMIEEDLASVSPGEGVLEGPLTDAMVLPAIEDSPISSGGIISLEVTAIEGADASQAPLLKWYIAGEKKPTLEIASPIPKPPGPSVPETLFVSDEQDEAVGVDSTLQSITENLLSASSVLLAGAHGSGKTSVVRLIAKRLSGAPHFYRVIDPGSLSKIADERVAVVKENLTRWFSEATWMAGKSSRSILLLDDLDRLCAVESENQDNSRIRQLSEVFVATVKKFTAGKSIVVLASCQAKESLHNHLVGSHVFRETIPLKAMTKEGRRTLLDGIVRTRGSVDLSLDLREISAKTEGYMPGDLALLVDRARHEAVVRMVDSSDSSTVNSLVLGPDDFDAALAGFVPAGLRGVKLQTSGAAWKDVGGLKETRKILLETLEWPTKYAPIFASCPLRLRSGLLLYGYPGCGKTLLASAVAGECGLNFISVKGPEILNKYIGASEKSVRDLFERAQGAKPCVLFFDEFDSIAPKRGHDSTGVTDRVVNQMLTQMDGAEGLDGVYVLAATSRPDLIDPALLRPGRLDKSLICDLPDREDRLDIIRAVGSKVRFSQDVDLEEIARRTEGYSGADLQAVVYNAHLEAVQGVIGEEIKRKEEIEEKPVDNEQDLEFLEFVWGDSKGKGKGGQDRRTRGKERGMLVEKLASLKASLEAGKPSAAKSVTENGEGKKAEIKITWEHVETSLKTTRPSISAQEQLRLKKIYEEFIGARNGEMPSGQGSTGIGGRSSLM